MKKVLFIGCLMLHSLLNAQTKSVEKGNDNDALYKQLDSQDSLILARPYFQIGGNYVSKVAYNGRTEGVNQYGISPTARIHFGKGWALDYEGGFFSASSPQYSFSSIGLSKTFDVGSAEIALGYSRWFFNYAKNATDRSDYTGELDFSINWSVGDFTIGSSNALLTGKQRSLFLEPIIGWETSGRLGSNLAFKWTFNPTAAIDFGSDVTTRVVKLRPNRPGRLVSKPFFGILNYDISLPISLAFKGSELTLAYHFYVPKNVELPNTTTPFGVFEVAFNQRFGF
jgi:hypothetical protein